MMSITKTVAAPPRNDNNNLDHFQADRPAIDGLILRNFAIERDLAALVDLVNMCNRADGADWLETADALRVFFENPTGCDITRDYWIAEVDGKMVGGAWIQRRDQSDGERVYSLRGRVHPDWRRRGIGRWLLRGSLRAAQAWEARDASRAKGRVQAQAVLDTPSDGKRCLIETHGFTPNRYIYLMTRPLDGRYPDFRLPEGLEIRPVGNKDKRAVWEADVEAFRDHWGYSPPEEADYARYAAMPIVNPVLFKVAFDREGKIAGIVQNFVDTDENAALGMRRGWTEDISTRRDWRRKGVARALIVESLKLHEALGMTEAALHVDTENPTGALKVYEDCGYRPVKTEIVYRRPLSDG